jgi:diguanylate cyclase (GGDEF)-like protein
VANHRVFHERLRAAYAHARRHRRPLALIVFDVDLFKQVNDSRGHQAGDDVLIALADRVDSGVREGELLARLGGDEFAILLPDADATAAMAAAERLRAAVAARPLAGSDVTVSIGVCTIEDAGSPDELLRLADGALYWGKAQGRNRSTLYQRETVAYLSATERADRLERSRTLAGVRALARAVDAKDRSTHAHSERVAHVAGLLATAIGWPAERVALLREVALMHDVGKIGVPDHILLKPDRLTEEEYEQVKQHAALGAQIACEVLSAEQVAWVRGHHERYDARGYPDGLAGPEIADGAALLALADAWDAMVSDRPYSRGRTVEEALEECRRGSGAQFAPHAVAALEGVYAAGHLLSP